MKPEMQVARHLPLPCFPKDRTLPGAFKPVLIREVQGHFLKLAHENQTMMDITAEKNASAPAAERHAPAGNDFPYWIGLDVSKDSFTAAAWHVLGCRAAVFPPREKFSFGKKDVKELLAWAKSVTGTFGFGIAMEETGVYSKRLFKVIKSVAPDQHVAVCNAKAVSLYARSFTEEKNDRADAAVIARFACDRHPAEPRRMDADETRLQALVRNRDRLVETLQAMKNFLGTVDDREMRKVNGGPVKALEAAIEKLDTMIREAVRGSQKIQHEVELMTTVPGVALLSAACIYAELGPLECYTRKQISALSGVCPVNRLSGTSVKKHSISHHGSRLLRKILYLDCQQAIPRIPAMAEFHRRMSLKTESSRMSARCACMRKLLLILHAIVVNERPFDPNYKSEPFFKKTNSAT